VEEAMIDPALVRADAAAGRGLCVRCSMAPDAQYFDESSIVPLPPRGRDAVLARFALGPQYCAVVEYFTQFTNLLAINPADVETPGLDWALLSNGRPLAPYLRFDRILNPWGYSSLRVGLRVEDGATIELVVRNRAYAPAPGAPRVDRVGGRIVGRYWYDAAYGDAGRSGD
jgi:hypothetical protein